MGRSPLRTQIRQALRCCRPPRPTRQALRLQQGRRTCPRSPHRQEGLQAPLKCSPLSLKDTFTFISTQHKTNKKRNQQQTKPNEKELCLSPHFYFSIYIYFFFIHFSLFILYA